MSTLIRALKEEIVLLGAQVYWELEHKSKGRNDMENYLEIHVPFHIVSAICFI